MKMAFFIIALLCAKMLLTQTATKTVAQLFNFWEYCMDACLFGLHILSFK